MAKHDHHNNKNNNNNIDDDYGQRAETNAKNQQKTIHCCVSMDSPQLPPFHSLTPPPILVAYVYVVPFFFFCFSRIISFTLSILVYQSHPTNVLSHIFDLVYTNICWQHVSALRLSRKGVSLCVVVAVAAVVVVAC